MRDLALANIEAVAEMLVLAERRLIALVGQCQRERQGDVVVEVLGTAPGMLATQ